MSRAAATIAVVMPFYRDDRWFPEAIASVLGQERTPDEIVVVDDASGPGHARALEALPPSVRVIRLLGNRGPGNARQVGTESTTAEFITYLDSDDRWPANFLGSCEAALTAAPELAAVYTGVARLLPDGTRREYAAKPPNLEVREALVRFHAYPAIGMMFRRAALMEVGGWDRSRLAVEDWDLVVRFTQRFGPIRLVTGTLPEYRVRHSGQRLNSQGVRKLICFWHTFRANREILELHFGRAAVRRRFAQAVRDRGDVRRGIPARCYRLGGWLLGPPLERDHPVRDVVT